MRLTRPSVLDLLKGIRLVIHTIVPEKYRFIGRLSINLLLSKPTSICAASKDILLCEDDEQRSIMQLELVYNGVATPMT